MDKVQFNEKQLIAIRHHEKPMLVLAGPGSGKTTVIIHRVKYLLETYQVPASSILVITFTKAAAMEMKERFLALGTERGQGVTFCTFHSLFFRILRRAYGYGVGQVLGEEEKWNVLRRILREIEVETNDEDEYIRNFLSELSRMKNDLIDLQHYHSMGFPEDEFKQMYKKYDAYKAREEKIDFDDMMTHCYELLTTDKEALELWQKQFSYILIDEFQDSNCAQCECIKRLALPENNLFAVGDDDQSIYQFRGARPSFLLDFEKELPDAVSVTLDINYRSTEKMIALAEKVIEHNKKRLPKGMKGMGEEGRKIVFFTAEDAAEEGRKIGDKITALQKKGIPYEKMAIIYRTNVQGSVFAKTLFHRGIPYILKDRGTNIYGHWITKDILAYMALAADESDDISFRRIINKPKRYISKELLQKGEEMPYPLLRGLFLAPELKRWQAEQLESLRQHLAQIRKRKPFEAVNYIRNMVAYDEYLVEYAGFRKASPDGLKEIADELTQTAKDADTAQDFFEKVNALDCEMRKSGQKNNKQPDHAVTLTTMHSAKGLEFDTVFIPSIIEGFIPHEKSVTQEEIEEERRLFYVGITRARKRLYLSEITKRHDKRTKRSRFLKEIGLK